MNEPPPPPTVAAAYRSWLRVIGVVLAVTFMAGTYFIIRRIIETPERTVDKAMGLVKESGRQLRSIAEAFHQGTVRTEFLSHASEVTGTSRFQFATLKQNETFKREETGTTAWGWVPLPKVVVQAQAPVEYTYTVDFSAPWQIEREGDTVHVFAPPIEANAPAIDVSALDFYTLEGSLWRDESAVREKLRASLTAALKDRARNNEPLVREIGRKRCAEFFEKWLTTHFHDADRIHVKVVFPDERPVTTVENKQL